MVENRKCKHFNDCKQMMRIKINFLKDPCIKVALSSNAGINILVTNFYNEKCKMWRFNF